MTPSVEGVSQLASKPGLPSSRAGISYELSQVYLVAPLKPLVQTVQAGFGVETPANRQGL